MNILQVIPYFSPKKGGDVSVAYNLSKYLYKMGHNVTVITTNYEFDENYAESLKGVSVIPFQCQLNLGGLLLSTSMGKFLKKNISNFDIIHVHNFRTYQNIQISWYAKKNNVPYIVQAHGSLPRIMQKESLKYFFDITVGYKILRDAVNVISVSNIEYDHYRKMGVPKGKIVTISNGIDVNAFQKLPSEGTFRRQFNISQDRIILYLGRLHQIKGLDFLIKTFSELVKDINDVVLVLAGPNDGYEIAARSLIDKLNLSDRVVFTGHLNGTVKLAAYVDAEVLVYPSVFEIFGLVPLEAVMCGIPVIVTENCGCGELIKESKSGYLVKYGDISSLEEKIKFILENSRKSNEFVNNSRKFIYDNLSWTNIVKKMEENYENCIHNI